jgi:hypothetical protein
MRSSDEVAMQFYPDRLIALQRTTPTPDRTEHQEEREEFHFVAPKTARIVLSAFFRIAYPVGRSIPGLPIFFYSVVSPRGSHPPPSLMLKRGLAEGQSLPAEAAAASLTQEHGFYALLVLAPALRGVGADFPAVSV